MGLAGVSSTLWHERELLELLLFKLEEEQLVLAARPHPLAAARHPEVEMVLERDPRAELLRAVEVDAAAAELGCRPGPSLRAARRGRRRALGRRCSRTTAQAFLDRDRGDPGPGQRQPRPARQRLPRRPRASCRWATVRDLHGRRRPQGGGYTGTSTSDLRSARRSCSTRPRDEELPMSTSADRTPPTPPWSPSAGHRGHRARTSPTSTRPATPASASTSQPPAARPSRRCTSKPTASATGVERLRHRPRSPTQFLEVRAHQSSRRSWLAADARPSAGIERRFAEPGETGLGAQPRRLLARVGRRREPARRPEAPGRARAAGADAGLQLHRRQREPGSPPSAQTRAEQLHTVGHRGQRPRRPHGRAEPARSARDIAGRRARRTSCRTSATSSSCKLSRAVGATGAARRRTARVDVFVGGTALVRGSAPSSCRSRRRRPRRRLRRHGRASRASSRHGRHPSRSRRAALHGVARTSATRPSSRATVTTLDTVATRAATTSTPCTRPASTSPAPRRPGRSSAPTTARRPSPPPTDQGRPTLVTIGASADRRRERRRRHRRSGSPRSPASADGRMLPQTSSSTWRVEPQTRPPRADDPGCMTAQVDDAPSSRPPASTSTRR